MMKPLASARPRHTISSIAGAARHCAQLVGVLTAILVSNGWSAEVKLPSATSESWNLVGRTTLQQAPDAMTLSGGFAVTKETLGDGEVSFQARAPQGTEQVQIWAGLRCRDRDSRYVVALRGGNNNDVYFARYAPDGGTRFLGLAPLNFKPEVGKWYTLRLVTLGNRFQIFINDEKLPRLNVEDPEALWQTGGVALGGGWVPTEFAHLEIKPLNDQSKAAFAAVGTSSWQPAPFDREARRKEQRSAYQPCVVKALGTERTEISLDGQWLFKPDQELTKDQEPQQIAFDDQPWHVLEVPAFWCPSLAWLFGESGFAKLKGVSDVARQRGQSDNIYKEELARLDAYTFDWKKTKGGWYRHHINLPEAMKGRHLELCFDAIAKVAEIWVNGKKVGSHTGMFGEIKCDVTAAVQPGDNVVAVHAVQNWDRPQTAHNDVQGVAVTVEITSKMLNSLPHGMYDDRAAGIWQPVKLVVTAPSSIRDIFIQPSLQSAKIQLSVVNAGTAPQPVEIGYTITSKKDGVILTTQERAAAGSLPVAKETSFDLATPKLAPKLWSPADPNLYELELRLSANGRIIDRTKTTFGFRTFATEGNRLLLNGKPYWLRGGNHFPSFIRPNDPELANRFIQLAHEGNVRVTRSHGAPMTDTWLNAADEIGMGVSYEGTWPWLMLKGAPPDAELLKIWKDEFVSLIHKTRNHPSIILWTVNNEMKFPIFDKNDPEMLKKKWTIITDMVKTVRGIDPTRPVIMDSGYLRKEGNYEKILQPNGFDDGDIDDAHNYFGWYNPTFFHQFKGEFGKAGWPGRPLISQEMSTGYPRTDDGHPTRGYLFQHYTPQSLVGNDAYEHADPAIFLQRQAFMTKELAEALRRTNRQTASGVMHFAYLTWFQNVADAQKIKPAEGARALAQALQPVLVSAELFGRHFYAGSTVKRRVCVANDSDNESGLPASQLVWTIEQNGKSLTEGTAQLPATGYYENQWTDVEFKMPEKLPSPRIDAQLTLRLEANGVVVSKNSYDIAIATHEWAQNGIKANQNGIAIYDPNSRASHLLDPLGAPKLVSLATLKPGQPRLLIVGDVDALAKNAPDLQKMRDFTTHGGRVLLLNSGKNLPTLFPQQIVGYRATKGEIVSMHTPESPVFDGIAPLDIAWFEVDGEPLPYACKGVHQIVPSRADVTALAEEFDIHGYLNKPEEVVKISGTPLLRLQLGQGEIINSEMVFEAGHNDPIAQRLLSNTVRYLLQQSVAKPTR